jgi:hypothetical protein
MGFPHAVPTIHLLGAGSYPRFFYEKGVPVLRELGVTHSIATVGVAEFNLKTMTYHHFDISIPGALNITPPPIEILPAAGFATDADYARQMRQVWLRPAYAMVDKVINVNQRLRIVGAEVLWLQGMKTGHSEVAEEALRRLKSKDPSLFISTASVLPDDPHQRPQALIGYKLFEQLHHDGVAHVTYLSDNGGPFALQYKLNILDRYQAVAEASLISASAQFGRTKAFGEISKSLGKLSPFASFAFASRNIESFKDPLSQRVKGWFGGKKASDNLVWLDHVITEAELATETVLTDPTARAIDEAIDLKTPYFVVYTVPLAMQNGPAWDQLSNEIRRFLRTHWPSATPIFCSGQGTPHPHYSGTSWLQVSAIFPIPPVPTPIREALKNPPPQLHADPFEDTEEFVAPTFSTNHA